MDILDYMYRPKKGLISSQEVIRPEGYTRSFVHMHDHTEILLVTSQCVCEILSNGNRFTVQAPAILLHQPGTFHEVIQIQSGTYVSQVLHFPDMLLEEIPVNLFRSTALFDSDIRILPLTEEEKAGFLPWFSLLREKESNRQQQLLLVLCILSEMSALLRKKPGLSAKIRETYIFDVIAAIRQEPEAKITTASLSQRFHVSQTKLKQDFRQITGMSIKTFSLQSRLHKALLFLESTGDDLASIAYSCGFSGESHFIEAFRKAYGITPGAFRKKNAENAAPDPSR